MAKSTMSQSNVTTENSDDENSESEMESKSSDDVSQSVCVLPRHTRVSTPVSILIESLVMNICSIYEADAQKATQMYKLICNRLHKMNMIDESFDMNEFEGMRSQLQRGFIQLVTSKLSNKQISLNPSWPRNNIIDSHYFREFDEIRYIAGGGFGQVFLVRHKLDGTEYAIKKIPIRSEGINSVRSYLSEVKTFASLNHSNIVQYKAAWLEIGDSTCKPINNSKINGSSNKIKNKQIEHIDDEYVFSKEVTPSFSDRHSDNSEFEIDFQHSISNIRNCSISKSKTNLSKHNKSKSVSDINVLCKVNFNQFEQFRVQKPVKWATLYIQMALCQSTLKQWLEKRNEVELVQMNKAIVPLNAQSVRVKTNFEILTQLLKGIEYIHSKGIVHHDIKPSNIFIQRDKENILVQLGDFGLACPLQSVRHSLAFGTKLYAAPEQLAGKCESKSDLYSLGIVGFELVQNFNTDMERVENITELRKGILPEDLVFREPQFAEIIKELTSKKPEDRPDTTSLLKRIEKSTESQQIEQLKQRLAEKEDEILHLKELLKSHGIKGI